MRMSLIALGLMAVLLFAPAYAEETEESFEGWQVSADLGLNFTQSAYSNSWDGSEESSINWTFTGNMVAETYLRETLNWRNTLKLTFGQTHTEERRTVGDKAERSWAKPQKSSDRIFLESLLRADFGYYVDPYAALTVETQFYNTFVPGEDAIAAGGEEITYYLDPMTLTESAGVGRKFITREELELYSRLGFAVRQHFFRRIVSFVPEETESETETDGGLEWVTDYAHTFADGEMKYVSKLRIFQALFYSESDRYDGTALEDSDVADYWKSPDVAWENTLSASVSKYIQVSLFFELLYDKEVDLRGRFREILGLGVAYKLF